MFIRREPGKPVRIRRGRATVRGSESAKMPLDIRKSGKAWRNDDPEPGDRGLLNEHHCLRGIGECSHYLIYALLKRNPVYTNGVPFIFKYGN